jgi:hypothetical protein
VGLFGKRVVFEEKKNVNVSVVWVGVEGEKEDRLHPLEKVEVLGE